MSIGVHRSDKSRHLVLRLSPGEAIPEALCATLREEQVGAGWLRASGILEDIELRTYDAGLGLMGDPRRTEGRMHALSLEGSVGSADGDVSLSLRGLLARDIDGRLEMLSGEVCSARVVGLEVIVTALDGVVLERTLDEATGIWLLGDVSAKPPLRQPPATARWSAALDVSDRATSDRADRGSRPRPPLVSPAHTVTAIPARPPPPPKRPDVDAPVPEPGDAVDHFAFGDCDVLKSDGDRLHLRVHKGGRVREIALAMLRVSRLDDADDGRRRFKLERRI